MKFIYFLNENNKKNIIRWAEYENFSYMPCLALLHFTLFIFYLFIYLFLGQG